MGVQDNAEHERRANKRERAKESRGRRKSASQAIAWSEFAWLDFAALTVALANKGGAVRLGTTRDGGAWALGIYLDNDYATEYIKPTEDCREAIAEIAEAWLGAGWGKQIADAQKAIQGDKTA